MSDFAFGWHPVAEFDAMQGGTAYPTVRSYMWGLDVTGTLHGGGGVGGLLLTTDGTHHQIPLYDANGNVQGLIDAGDGTLEAVYSYSASCPQSNPLQRLKQKTMAETMQSVRSICAIG